LTSSSDMPTFCERQTIYRLTTVIYFQNLISYYKLPQMIWLGVHLVNCAFDQMRLRH